MVDFSFLRQEKTAGFIDGPNFYAAYRQLGVEIDFKKMLHVFQEKTQLLRMFYYTALVEGIGDDGKPIFQPIRPLMDWLDYNGYTMVTKSAKEYTDPSTNKRRTKGNMDIELAIDMLEMSQYIDHAVLFSGDGDFRRLVEVVQRRGVKVTVISTLKSRQPMVSDDLRRQCDLFVELDDILPGLSRPISNNTPSDFGEKGK